MKKNYFLQNVALLFALFGASISWGQTTFNYTGGLQTYTVPPGVTSISIDVTGAAGGNELGGGAVVSAPGLGAQMIGTFTVTPGEELTLLVGEEGQSANFVGGGGGGSFVWNEAEELLIAAGGGGGAGYTDIGGDVYVGLDATTTEAGTNGNGMPNGVGAAGNGGTIPTTPTYAGGGAGWLSGGNNGTVHSCEQNCTGGQRPLDGGAGGLGGGTIDYSAANGGYGGGGGGNARCGAVGGGGGGGYTGGGAGGEPVSGGYNGGGGGGSFNSGTDQENTAGVGTGNGVIIITELCDAITLTASSLEICLGEELTLSGTAESGADVNWEDGVEDGVAFTPETAGTITYTASTEDGSDCITTIEITVHELPDVTVSADAEIVCEGDEVNFSVSGADSYSFDPPEILYGFPYTPELGITTVTVTGTDDETGCVNSDMMTIEVLPLPTVSANVTDDEICLGESIILTGSGATTYTWDPESVEDGVSFTPDMTGTMTYTVEGTDEFGCTNEDSIEVTVFDAIEITYTTTDEMMGSDGEIDITVTGGNPAYSFDWDNDGTGDFDDPEDLTGLAGGTYIVVVEDEAGCSATETITVSSQLSLEDLQRIVKVFPNPAKEVVQIQLSGSFDYSIMTVDGQRLINGVSQDNETIDLNEFVDGVYIIQLKQGNKTHVVRLVIQ
jgi:hypothetical protein